MKNRNLSQALFEALDQDGMTAKELSKLAGVTEAQISRFRKGGDLYSSAVQRLIDALPTSIYNRFLSLLSNKEEVREQSQSSEIKIAEQIWQLARELKRNRTQKNKDKLAKKLVSTRNIDS